MRTRAMLATSIAELFIEEDGVRVELEIGVDAIEAFGNLLPDAIYAKTGLPDAPIADRLHNFFVDDLVISGADGTPIPGRLVSIAPRPRLRRDQITGEPIPATEDEEPEIAVFAELHYPFSERPDSLTLSWAGRSGTTDVGFVVYHRGVAVNDFRYLGGGYALDLDWEDPWYSAFERRNLRRNYASAMSGFLYVEPYEVRKEIILRPRDLQQWIDLGLQGRTTIPAAMQPELLRKIVDFLREHHPVTIDGEALAPELLRANFLRRTLRNSTVVDPPEDLPLDSATVGVIFAYAVPGMPEHASLRWDLWNDRIRSVPVAAVDPAGPLPSTLSEDDPELRWQNFIRFPVMPTLTVNEAPPGVMESAVSALRWPFAGVALILALMAVRAGPRQRAMGIGAAALLVLSAASFMVAGRARIEGDRAERLVSGLLHNVYRAFDFRDEGKIYDVLSHSASGDLLEQLYLETRASLEIASQGGARARVQEIEVLDLEIAPSDDDEGLVARARWNVAGSVGHWGHVHRRTNQYHAELGLAPIDGAWKLTRLEVLEETRL
jgi:hypothetical protein